MSHQDRRVPRQRLETFKGRVENTVPGSAIGWIRCTEVNGQPCDLVLFFHENYTKAGVLPEPGTIVKGNISRTADPTRQDRAMNVEEVDGAE